MAGQRVIFPVLFWGLCVTTSFAQEITPIKDAAPILPKERPAIITNDTIPANNIPIDSLAAGDTTKLAPAGDFKTTIKYSATDSIVMDRVNEITYLYGDARIEYGDITIEAAIIQLNQRNNTLKADGVVDSVGKKIGTPKFTDKGVEYVTQGMQYNFKTQRAISEGLVTEQNQGYIHGEQVFKDEKDNLYVSKAKYTTCDLAHPHFEIRSGKIKRSGKNVITGPFNLWFNDVPTPLGLPFGMFPDQQQRTSGIVVPTYGEERQRGFFLRDGGYYFDINDHINLTALGEIYSKGGWGVKFNSTYKKRYAYNGNFSFHFAKRTSGIEGDESNSNDFSLRWGYTPFARGTSRFSASVNAATRTYNQNNSLSIIQNFNANLNSSVSYAKTFQGTPFNMTLSARHTQNLTTGIVDITLPELSANMNRQSPFKRSRIGLLKNFNFAWNANLRNRVSNQPLSRGVSFDIVDEGASVNDTLEFNFANIPTLFENAENGVRMNIPISTSSKLFKYFNFSPSFNFNDLWYLEKLQYTYDEELQAVNIDTVQGFTRAGTYSIGAGLSTRIYGTFLFKEGKKVEAIRHTIIPSVSFSYAPDFTNPSFDYYQEVQVDSTGKTQLLSRYEGFVFGSPTRGHSGSIGFNLQNTLEMKVKSKNDTTKTSKKIPLLRNLGFSTSYNLIAEEFNLSNFRLTASTNILNNLINFSAAATIDPYIYELDNPDETMVPGAPIQQTRVNKFAWKEGQGLGQLRNANFSFSTRLNPKILKGDDSSPVEEVEDPQDRGFDGEGLGEIITPAQEAEIAFIEANPDLYIDFKIPWSLSLQFNLNYNKVGFQEARVTQSLRFNGDFSLSEKWKVDFSSGFDFEAAEFTDTRIGINRDLHCWDMNFSWRPFGRFQSYSITINARASLLQDLKLSRRKSFIDSGAAFN